MKDTVKGLLEKWYGGEPKSLTIDAKPRKSSKTAYYYALPNLEEVRCTRDALNTVVTYNPNPLKQMYDLHPRKSTNSDRQVACYTEDGDQWNIEFYKIEGVSFHISYGFKIAATLITSSKPVVSIGNFEESFGYWHRPFGAAKNQTADGLSYWVNKNIFSNSAFRGFTVDFFNAVGASSGMYLFKDCARTIEKNHFLAPIPFSEILSKKTPKQVMHSMFPASVDCKINFNAVDLNLAYIMAYMAGFIARQDWKYLRELPSEAVGKIIKLKSLWDGLSVEDAVSGYYQWKISVSEEMYYDDDDIISIAKDYAKMCMDNDLPIRLGYSYEGLLNAHDHVSYIDRKKNLKNELEAPLVTMPSVFDPLERALCEKYPPDEFERIKTSDRLLSEGENQHNCVFSRRELLKDDRAAVFHWCHRGNEITVQFGKIGGFEPIYYIQEIKARFNESVPRDVLNELQVTLREINGVQNDPDSIEDDDQFVIW